MRKLKILLAAAMMLVLMLPLTAAAEETPIIPTALKSISFKNAVIEEEFSPFSYEYKLILEDRTLTPTLESYEIQGDANIFVTYSLDEAKHQTGIIVTLEYDNGTVKYTFNYKNAEVYEQSGNNLLKSVSCVLGEVYPQINDGDTSYKLYIPSDLTVINLTAVTQDVGAYCDVPYEISLGADQEPVINITVTASNGETKNYSFKVRRVKKTSDEVKAEIENGEYVSLAKGELFYQKPVFLIVIAGAALGIIALLIIVRTAKRLTVKVGDKDETEFFEE